MNDQDSSRSLPPRDLESRQEHTQRQRLSGLRRDSSSVSSSSATRTSMSTRNLDMGMEWKGGRKPRYRPSRSVQRKDLPDEPWTERRGDQEGDQKVSKTVTPDTNAPPQRRSTGVRERSHYPSGLFCSWKLCEMLQWLCLFIFIAITIIVTAIAAREIAGSIGNMIPGEVTWFLRKIWAYLSRDMLSNLMDEPDSSSGTDASADDGRKHENIQLERFVAYGPLLSRIKIEDLILHQVALGLASLSVSLSGPRTKVLSRLQAQVNEARRTYGLCMDTYNMCSDDWKGNTTNYIRGLGDMELAFAQEYEVEIAAQKDNQDSQAPTGGHGGISWLSELLESISPTRIQGQQQQQRARDEITRRHISRIRSSLLEREIFLQSSHSCLAVARGVLKTEPTFLSTLCRNIDRQIHLLTVEVLPPDDYLGNQDVKVYRGQLQNLHANLKSSCSIAESTAEALEDAAISVETMMKLIAASLLELNVKTATFEEAMSAEGNAKGRGGTNTRFGQEYKARARVTVLAGLLSIVRGQKEAGFV